MSPFLKETLRHFPPFLGEAKSGVTLSRKALGRETALPNFPFS